MNEYVIIFGAAMTVFIFINFFLKSWWISFAALILGTGCLVELSKSSPINVYLFCAVGVVAVGQLISLMIVKHSDA
jgi:hypothetical protein